MSQRRHQSVLFLCTGNYYRSRFAEILFNSVAGKMGMPWKAGSRGLALERGIHNVGPIASLAREGLQALRISPDDAWSRFPIALAVADLEQAARVVALKHDEHRPLLQERFPEWVEKVEYWHVDDAPGVLGLVEKEVMNLVARLMGGKVAPDDPVPEPVPRRDVGREAVTVRVGRETKGRRGKGVTIVFDLPLDDTGLRELAAALKQKCGTGGTVKDGHIEIQGDQRDRLMDELRRLGYKVKRAGG